MSVSVYVCMCICGGDGDCDQAKRQLQDVAESGGFLRICICMCT